jgi:hypothetical protein
MPGAVVAGADPRHVDAALTTAHEETRPRSRGAKGVEGHGDQAVRWESAV